MQYFAKIENNLVTQVIVADQEFIDSGAVGDPANWVETFVGGGVRKNYAGKGMTYDKVLDIFYDPQPFLSWSLNEETGKWEAPIVCPDGKGCVWDEDKLKWGRLKN